MGWMEIIDGEEGWGEDMAGAFAEGFVIVKEAASVMTHFLPTKG